MKTTDTQKNMEKELVERVKKGDDNAFEDIIKLYEQKVHSTIFYMIKNESAVEDIAQEVFIKVYRNLSKFNEKSSLYTWIYRITVNACYDEIKREKKIISISNHIDTEDGEQEVEFEDEKQNVSEIVESKLERKMLIDTIKMLPEESRSLIVLRDIRGFSYWEIADMLNMKLGTVKSKINRSRNQLKTLLESKGFNYYLDNQD